MATEHRLNKNIRAAELRVIGPEGENLGVMPFADALKKAEEAHLDLIEISPGATPPIAKIADYGKFLYAESKKQKAAKAKVHSTEIKNIQIKVGTGEHDLSMKAKKASEWVREGNRVKIDLFLPGRTKYMNEGFLRERLEKFLNLVTEEHKTADTPKKSPKGITVVIEKK